LRSRINFRQTLGEFAERAEALVFILAQVRESGPVTFGFGADWWFEARLDGKLLVETVSRFATGNVAYPPNPSNHMAPRIDAGEHLLVVRLIAGRDSTAFAVGGPADLPCHGTISNNTWQDFLS